MRLTSQDFWPPIQGGWELHRGHLVPVSAVVSALEKCLNCPIARHPDLVNAEDESDLQSFLEERCAEASIPAPDCVIDPTRKLKGLPGSLGSEPHALWSQLAWAKSSKLQEALSGAAPLGPVQFQVRHARYLAAGASLVLWLLVGAMLLALIRASA